MIICNSRKYVFIHIPKCGGSTISSLLERGLRAQDVTLNRSQHAGWGPFIEAYRQRYKLFKHSYSHEIASAMGPANYADYFVFTFCRNPFSRAYSAFTFTKSADAKHRPDSERYQDIKEMDFEQFLASKWMQERNILQARPQSLWVKDSSVPVTHYRLEDIDTVLPELATRLYGQGAPMPDKIARANSSAPREAWKSMSPEAEAMVRDLYAEDFATFGYDDHIDRGPAVDG